MDKLNRGGVQSQGLLNIHRQKDSMQNPLCLGKMLELLYKVSWGAAFFYITIIMFAYNMVCN